MDSGSIAELNSVEKPLFDITMHQLQYTVLLHCNVNDIRNAQYGQITIYQTVRRYEKLEL